MIQSIVLYPYKIELTKGPSRTAFILELIADQQKYLGEVAPLPGWNQETLEDVWRQFVQIQKKILTTSWSKENLIEELKKFSLFPSLSFGLESTLLKYLDPILVENKSHAALFMGTPQEIYEQAKMCKSKFAKIKVGNLLKEDTFSLLQDLKNDFRLRVDVNQRWSASEALDFFSKFSDEDFDYVEDPLPNQHDLKSFPLPFALDFSHAKEKFSPKLKAFIYKPTVRGGLAQALPILAWTKQNNIDFVLSSSFESRVGLQCILELGERLSLTAPIGLGTSSFLL